VGGNFVVKLGAAEQRDQVGQLKESLQKRSYVCISHMGGKEGELRQEGRLIPAV